MKKNLPNRNFPAVEKNERKMFRRPFQAVLQAHHSPRGSAPAHQNMLSAVRFHGKMLQRLADCFFGDFPGTVR